MIREFFNNIILILCNEIFANLVISFTIGPFYLDKNTALLFDEDS
jgi:hypothetical protein